MNERFGTKLRALVAAGLTLPSGADAKIVDLEKFPKNGNPTAIVEFLRPRAQTPGHMTESIAISVKGHDRYFSAAADPGFGIVRSDDNRRMLDQIQKENKILLNGMEIWLAHSHAADHITAYAVTGGLSEDVVTNPQALLNGPSLYDCPSFLREKVLFKGYEKTSIINLIVEPGGNWVCSGEFPRDGYSDEIADAYDHARQELLIATQSEKKNIRAGIRSFEQEAFRLTGVRVKYVPHGASVADFERAKEEVRR